MINRLPSAFQLPIYCVAVWFLMSLQHTHWMSAMLPPWATAAAPLISAPIHPAWADPINTGIAASPVSATAPAMATAARVPATTFFLSTFFTKLTVAFWIRFAVMHIFLIFGAACLLVDLATFDLIGDFSLRSYLFSKLTFHNSYYSHFHFLIYTLKTFKIKIFLEAVR